ncbi:conserved hypothetical protein [Burkholderia pseudomallei MSHR346]|uniref:Uncharacterized protein n=1 Tax=Burkholderia pseudomallei 1710a TaxID=320371 RepID=A0A0E1WFA6_BURPE|nr:conserved hypothetical protein [Burkholderia pseudomallei MSHR346]EDO92258.1 hypothetical protein BURPSPAST_AA0751 [Burkholderia pseudomallei Pasteur 52237]EET08287.1 hypothetical protein BURPS1710A_2565 [Burkholderia pseudomallei 1710a]
MFDLFNRAAASSPSKPSIRPISKRIRSGWLDRRFFQIGTLKTPPFPPRRR